MKERIEDKGQRRVKGWKSIGEKRKKVKQMDVDIFKNWNFDQ